MKPGPLTKVSDHKFLEMPNPSAEELASPLFEAIWQTAKNWDLNVPTHYVGYCGFNGSHVKMLLDNIAAAGLAVIKVQ